MSVLGHCAVHVSSLRPGRGRVLTPSWCSPGRPDQTRRHTFLCLEFSLSDITTLALRCHVSITTLHSHGVTITQPSGLYFMFPLYVMSVKTFTTRLSAFFIGANNLIKKLGIIQLCKVSKHGVILEFVT